ncbi:MAG: hypothetical protein DMG89_02195 [Acidobacteria bacterium]|nr:MAG: hypothetical protein DMG89_02195 [Acidobacteriota bacterium]
MLLLKPLPHRKLKLRRLPSRKLTICIAANAEHGKYLVCAADTMVASNLATTDPLAAKIHFVADWAIMLSGTLGHVDSLVDALTRRMLSASDNDPKTIKHLLETAHREELGSWSAGHYLAPFGLDMPTFLSKGKRYPTQVQSDLSRSIALGAEEYDAEIIVCGWGATATSLAQERKSRPYPYIFSADYQGIKLHKTAGLYACGSGAPAALSTLYFHNCRPGMDVATVIYYVATAKFMAERTLGVGPNTVMFAMKRTGGLVPVTSDHLKQMRKLWIDEGSPRLPNTATALVTSLLGDNLKDD